MIRRALTLFTLCLLGFGTFRPAAAQFAVIDVASITQLIQQYQTLQQQLLTTQQALTQAQLQYQSMTGTRGMQNLLSGTTRNYLPPTWNQLPATFAAPIQSTVNANAVLTPQQVAALSPSEQQFLAAARNNAALLQVSTQTAYVTTSNRFATLQQLINAIGTATDSKGAWDLQARIGAEQTMLINDTAKLGALYQAAQAQRWALQQRVQEQTLSDIGSLRTLPPIGLR